MTWFSSKSCPFFFSTAKKKEEGKKIKRRRKEGASIGRGIAKASHLKAQQVPPAPQARPTVVGAVLVREAHHSRHGTVRCGDNVHVQDLYYRVEGRVEILSAELYAHQAK